MKKGGVFIRAISYGRKKWYCKNGKREGVNRESERQLLEQAPGPGGRGETFSRRAAIYHHFPFSYEVALPLLFLLATCTDSGSDGPPGFPPLPSLPPTLSASALPDTSQVISFRPWSLSWSSREPSPWPALRNSYSAVSWQADLASSERGSRGLSVCPV